MKKPGEEKGYRRRTIAVAIVTGLVLLAFLARLAQFQWLEAGNYRVAIPGEEHEAAASLAPDDFS